MRVKHLAAVSIAALGMVYMFADICLGYELITKEKLREMLGKPGLYIIDVRTEEEWGYSLYKIPGAIHETGEFTTWHKKYPKDGTIVVY